MIAGSISSIVGGPCRCISFGSYMNLEYLHRPQIVALISLAGYGILLSCVITSYYVWTKFWTYRYPIPFQGLAVTNFMRACCPALIWVVFPKKWRKAKNLQKRMGNAVLQALFYMVCLFSYNIIIQVIRKSSSHYQLEVAQERL